MHKKFDLIIYGATGFTGRLATQYLMRKGLGDTLRVAIAGRHSEKLKNLQESCEVKPEIIIADSNQNSSIAAMVEQTKVIVNFAGPFALYGEPVIAACAKYGVDYLDITGETLFISDMIKRYQQQAVKTGARLIPFSGFDSIPADLLVHQALNVAQQHGWTLDKMHHYYQIKGGFNGGTLATALNSAKQTQVRGLRNPYNLIHDQSWSQTSKQVFQPYFEPVIGRWTAPFFMHPINNAVVQHSAWLRAQLGQTSQPLHYEERVVVGQQLGYLKAGFTTAVLTGFYLLSKCSFGRHMLKRIGPKPGEGPSAESRQNGFFRGRLVGYSKGKGKLIVSMEREGDPGNEITIALAIESARLAVENAFLHDRKGFLTPSVAFGDQLTNRLEKAGFRFKTELI